MMKVREMLYIFLLLTSVLQVFSQEAKPLRVEIEAKRGSDNYNIIPLGSEGLILFYESNEQRDLKKLWVFTKYDTLFKESWNNEIPVKRNLSYIRNYYDERHKKLFLLLIKLRSSVSAMPYCNKSEFLIISINMHSGKVSEAGGQIPERTIISDFIVTGSNAYISGNSYPSGLTSYFHSFISLTIIPSFTGLSFYRFKPVMVCVNTENSIITNIRQSFKGNAYLLNTQLSRDTVPALMSITKTVESRKQSFLYFYIYNNVNKPSAISKLPLPKDSTIVTARFIRINDGDYLAGTYKSLYRHFIRFNPFYSSVAELTLPADGIFFSRFTGGKPDFMRFYSFRNMGGIQGADYNLNKQISILKGNKSIMNDYRLLLHDIINKGDEYILVSEAYYPEYHIEYFWSTDAYGRSYRESREVFDGYRYTNAIITAFDSKGLLLWNNSFEIWNILTFNLKERVKVHFDGEDIVLAYSNAGKINSKIIRKNEVIQPKTESQVESISVADLKKPGITSDMDFWYKNYFITFGYEKLSRQPNISNAKTIFYFSKIAFQ